MAIADEVIDVVGGTGCHTGRLESLGHLVLGEGTAPRRHGGIDFSSVFHAASCGSELLSGREIGLSQHGGQAAPVVVAVHLNDAVRAAPRHGKRPEGASNSLMPSQKARVPGATDSRMYPAASCMNTVSI